MTRAIEKLVNTPNGGTASYHEVTKVEMHFRNGSPSPAVSVSSWASQESKESGGPLLWHWVLSSIEPPHSHIDFPLSGLGDPIQTLVSIPGTFFGGVVIDTESPDIVMVRRKKWAEIEAQYNTLLRDPLTVEGVGVFKADDFSQGKIKDVSLMATTCASMNIPFSVYFTDVNRVPVHLDTPLKAQKMGLALAAREQQLRAKRQTLWDAINEEDASIEEVQAISWN